MGISLWIQTDDVYGWTQLRRKSKRMMRRNWKKFMNDTRRYFRNEERVVLHQPDCR